MMIGELADIFMDEEEEKIIKQAAVEVRTL